METDAENATEEFEAARKREPDNMDDVSKEALITANPVINESEGY